MKNKELCYYCKKSKAPLTKRTGVWERICKGCKEEMTREHYEILNRIYSK